VVPFCGHFRPFLLRGRLCQAHCCACNFPTAEKIAPLRDLCGKAFFLHASRISASLNPENLSENPTVGDILNAFLYYLRSTSTEPYDHQ